MNITTCWNGVSCELVSLAVRGSVIAKKDFAQEKDMTPRLLVLTVTAALAFAGSAIAAGYSSTPSNTAQHSTSTAAKTTAPLGDNLTQNDVKTAIALSKVSNPVSTLANAKVDDQKGNTIGPVKSVITGKSGAPTAIHVDVDGRTVSMTARNFTYVKDRNILLTRMSKAQIEKLPAVKG